MAICRARSSSCRIGSSISLPDAVSQENRRTPTPVAPYPPASRVPSFPRPWGEGEGPFLQCRRTRSLPAWYGRLLVHAITVVAPLGLCGCGWAPLYGDPETGPASEELRAIKVAPISERIGQRLEIALRNSLNPTGEPTTPRYILRTSLSVALGNLGIQSQGLGTLGQLDVFADYTLSDLQNGSQLLANRVHVANSFDLNPNQYSTIVAEDDAAVRSVVELDQEIMARLTLFMQRRMAEKSTKPS
jgi:LPS-assembly lipoprotein